MHPDRRRAGRRIRVQRRRLRRAFAGMHIAATAAALSLGMFGNAIRATARHEEELARAAVESTNHEKEQSNG